MTKEELIKLGLTDELAVKVAETSAEELKTYVPKADLDNVSAKFAQLQADSKAKDETHAGEIKQLKMDSAITSALTAVKAKNMKAVKALLELDKAELLEDGTISGLDEQIKKLTSADDSKFLFDTEKAPKPPAFKGVKPAESKDGIGTVDTSKMSYEDMVTYLEQNPNATI